MKRRNYTVEVLDEKNLILMRFTYCGLRDDKVTAYINEVIKEYSKYGAKKVRLKEQTLA